MAERLTIEELEGVYDHFYELSNDAREKAKLHMSRATRISEQLRARGAMRLRVNQNTDVIHAQHPKHEWFTLCGYPEALRIKYGVGPTCGNCKKILKSMKKGN